MNSAKNTRIESYLLAKFTPKNFNSIIESNPNKQFKAGSLTKTLIALEALRKLDNKNLKNKDILVSRDNTENYGTDVLREVASEHEVSLSLQTLIRLMITFSCNSSTSLIAKAVGSRVKIHEASKNIWGLKKTHLIDKNGQYTNLTCISDLCKLFRNIYSDQHTLSQQRNDLLKDSLLHSRNIFYLFDQLELKVLGSKTGTYLEKNIYTIGDSGVVLLKDQHYFFGAIVSNPKISSAVKRIRQIGKIMKAKIINTK